MKKNLWSMVISLCVCFPIIFAACNNENHTEETNADTSIHTDTTTDDFAYSTSQEPGIFEGFERDVYEIVLPSDGEKIEYSPEFNIYTDEKSEKKLNVVSATREGDTITFFTEETDYYFEPLGMSLLTSQGEVFVSLNSEKTEDGTYKYEISKFSTSWPEDMTIECVNRDIKNSLGSEYDEDKSYYYISFANIRSDQ